MQKKKNISRGNILKFLVLFFTLIFLIPSIVNSTVELTDLQKVIGFLALTLFLLGLILKFYGMFNYESLNGEFIGFLEFNNRGISVDDKIYEIW